jgi:hypothetical protein
MAQSKGPRCALMAGSRSLVLIANDRDAAIQSLGGADCVSPSGTQTGPCLRLASAVDCDCRRQHRHELGISCRRGARSGYDGGCYLLAAVCAESIAGNLDAFTGRRARSLSERLLIPGTNTPDLALFVGRAGPSREHRRSLAGASADARLAGVVLAAMAELAPARF